MDDAQRRALLNLARETIRARLAGSPPPAIPAAPGDTAEVGGLFVTLRKKGRLKGCMGRFDSGRPLSETVQQVALSALRDPRFVERPLTADELTEVAIEISVLSKMVRTLDPLSLVEGVHGVYVRKGSRNGCFLPKVALEQHWDKVQMLSRCCETKAGLSADAWQDPDTEVYLFTAEVIEDEV